MRVNKIKNKKLSGKELKALMESRIVNVPMSEADVCILHAMAVLSDGRHTLNKMVKKWISPVALKILKERKEYH